MWIRTSSVLLATLVVSGLSLPRPDEYKIPSVGTGQRSQYYVLHSDGTFKYGFDTGDGAFESVKSHAVGDRVGKFGYVDPDGNRIHLEYEAGEGGFVARGDHLPKPSPELAQALAAVIRSSTPFVDPLAGTGGDASYGFEFQSDDHSRNEQSDADGTVTGSYSYVDENGVTRSFNYKAGRGIGFVIEGDGLTQDVGAPTPSVRQSTLGGTRQTTRIQHSSVRDSTRRAQTPSRPFGAAFRSSPTGSYTGPESDIAFTRSQTPGDASYSFSFDAGDHSRSETSDPNLNVDGTFSFVADDGNRRTVDYVAGSGTGFQAEGDHLPKAPEVDTATHGFTGGQRSQSFQQQRVSLKSAQRGQAVSSVRAPAHGSVQAVRGHYQAPSAVTHGQTSVHRPHGTGFAGTQRASFISPSRHFEEANIRSSFSPQGPYSFSYDTSSHSRSESGDEDNNVVGNFAFIADDDGQRREVTYESGSATGFIAEGAHIPVGPEVPGAPSGQPTGRIVPVASVRFVDPLADSHSDASYNFEFDSDTYSRSESADEDGNIEGSYTVVDETGIKTKYRFKAGKGVGFETEEVSRIQGPRPQRPVSYTGPLAGATPSVHTPSFRAASSRPSSPGTKVGFPFSHGQTSHRAPSFTKKVTPSTKSSFSAPHRRTQPGTKTKFTPSSFLKSSLTPSHSEQVFPGYTVHSYAASPNAEKYGYVLKFD